MLSLSNFLGLNLCGILDVPWFCALSRVFLTLWWRFPQDVEMCFMSTQTKHDEICVGSIYAVTRVWIEILLRSLRPDKIENLMFSFTGNKSIRKYDLEIFPVLVIIESLNNIEHKRFGETVHKFCSRSNDVRVEHGFT